MMSESEICAAVPAASPYAFSDVVRTDRAESVLVKPPVARSVAVFAISMAFSVSVPADIALYATRARSEAAAPVWLDNSLMLPENSSILTLSVSAMVDSCASDVSNSPPALTDAAPAAEIAVETAPTAALIPLAAKLPTEESPDFSPDVSSFVSKIKDPSALHIYSFGVKMLLNSSSSASSSSDSSGSISHSLFSSSR